MTKRLKVKRLAHLGIRLGKGRHNIRLTDPEQANLHALKTALGMNASEVVRLALDRLTLSMAPLSKLSAGTQTQGEAK